MIMMKAHCPEGLYNQTEHGKTLFSEAIRHILCQPVECPSMMQENLGSYCARGDMVWPVDIQRLSRGGIHSLLTYIQYDNTSYTNSRTGNHCHVTLFSGYTIKDVPGLLEWFHLNDNSFMWSKCLCLSAWNVQHELSTFCNEAILFWQKRNYLELVCNLAFPIWLGLFGLIWKWTIILWCDYASLYSTRNTAELYFFLKQIVR